MGEAFIVAALRTAGGRRNGRLAGWHPTALAAQVIDGLVDRSGIDPAAVDDVIMGCVSQVGEQSSNIGRIAVLASKLPESVPGCTVDRQCGSSQQALHFAAQAVMSGTMDVVIAAGVESMTRVPMFSAAQGGPFQAGRVREKYPQDFSQFTGAEMLARKFGLSRLNLDEFAFLSHQRAIEATRSGAFDAEILPVEVRRLEESPADEAHVVDEGIRFDATVEAIGQVRLLQEGGVVSAANASQICDGASGLMVANERAVKALGLKPLARVHHMSVLGHDPVIMLEAPLPATQRALKAVRLHIDDIDLYEVNEAFASVPLAWLKATGADPQRLNLNGGAIALGHPLGASGTKLMATLVHALRRHGKRYGLQTMCEAGGMANVTIVERV